MSEIFTFEVIRDLFLRFHAWGQSQLPDFVVPWVQSLFVLLIIFPLPIIAFEFVRNRNQKSSTMGKDQHNQSVDNLDLPNVDDPEAMVSGFEAVKQWTKEFGIPWSDVRLTFRENPENILARFHVPSVTLSNEQIESFFGKKIKDYAFERLFFARMCLGLTRGSLNVYRSVEGGTCIDAVIQTDRKLEKMKKEIRRLETLLRPDEMDMNRSPYVFDTMAATCTTRFRLLGNYFMRIFRARSPQGPSKTPSAVTHPSKST
ncbi:MAG: hypothetical protein Q8P84_02445 [Deltaproteobacteria bacterium]|nr:hypothetical protein [Deltaproteobacteria bacterium]